MTMAHGSGTRSRRSARRAAGSRSALPRAGAQTWTDAGRRGVRGLGRLPARGARLACSSPTSYSVFTAWPPNWLAQRRQHLARVALLLAAAEAGQQRERDDRRRHVQVDRLLHRPAALARVRDPAPDVARAPSPCCSKARPTSSSSHERMTVPCIQALAIGGEVERVLRRVQDLEALGVGLHQPVLDAVVDHLRVVAGAGRAAVDVAAVSGASARKMGSSGFDRVSRRRRPSCRSR